MTTKKKKTKYECLGGPLCGRMESGLGPSDFGFPCWKYEEDDGSKHFYRLARTKAGVKYWHYTGTRGIDPRRKPCLRPTPHDA